MLSYFGCQFWLLDTICNKYDKEKLWAQSLSTQAKCSGVANLNGNRKIGTSANQHTLVCQNHYP
jgi:hypothetical protein